MQPDCIIDETNNLEGKSLFDNKYKLLKYQYGWSRLQLSNWIIGVHSKDAWFQNLISQAFKNTKYNTNGYLYHPVSKR